VGVANCPDAAATLGLPRLQFLHIASAMSKTRGRAGLGTRLIAAVEAFKHV